MSFLKKTFGLLAIFSVIPATYAATARPGTTSANSRVGIVSTTASRRMPTMTTYLNSAIAGTSVGGNAITGSIAGSGVLDDEECRTSYDECIRDPEVCGPDFEECTTNILFHAQMPKCTNILMQCGASGINSLFGTSNIGALSTVAEYVKDAKGSEIEVKRYTYPIDSSVMGMAIIGGMHANQFPDSATCSKRYISCLNRDTVCGADFELCTSKSEFKKQSLQCESTLARCSADGVMSLFNVKQWTEKGTIDSGSVIGEMITAGADLAANNAVNTCYRVADQCFSAACANNPLRCIAGKSHSIINSADGLAGGSVVSNGTVTRTFDGTDYEDKIWSASDVNKFLGAACRDTIGANKYCQMTAMGKTPSKKELQDIDVQEEVFAEILNLRKSTFESNLTGLLQEFDTDAKNKCSETIKSCAMRTCGGGYGSLCWAQVYGDGKNGSIAGTDSQSLKEITTGCSAIVNADPYCIYAYQSGADKGAFGYSYYDGDVFGELFSAVDPLGVVAALNASLQSSYNASSIANMKKQCENVAVSCIKSMCGDKYENCYRNRTDITLNDSFLTTDNYTATVDMNKVGGVLDTVVVMGLCLNTVKNSQMCEEYLAIESQQYLVSDEFNQWGQHNNARGAWTTGDVLGAKLENTEIQEKDSNDNLLCYDEDSNKGPCGQMNPDNQKMYDTEQPVMVTYEEYALDSSSSDLFKNVLKDLELEAMAIYQSELVAEQQACYAANAGGIIGNQSSGSTYMWAKLKGADVPADYSINGLTSDKFIKSDELYESFCRVRVTLSSNDPVLQGVLNDQEFNDNFVRYFAVGDAITCGSWLDLGECSTNADDSLCKAIVDAVKDKNKHENNTKLAWGIPLGAVLTTGAALATGYTTKSGDMLGGLTGKKNKSKMESINKQKKSAESCIKTANEISGITDESEAKAKLSSVYGFANTAKVLGISNYNLEDDDKLSDIRIKAVQLSGLCGARKEELSDASGNADNAAIAVGVGTAVLGAGVTTAGLIGSIRATNDKEVQDILDNLNSKIRCYVNGEDSAGFGDIFEVTLD